jgi:hypothetical protein
MPSSLLPGSTTAAATGAALSVARAGARLAGVKGRLAAPLATVGGAVLLLVAYRMAVGGRAHAV